MHEHEREEIANRTMENIFQLLPNRPSRIWSDGSEILCQTESMAEAIADLFDAMYGVPIAHTGYYDPDEDERNNEVTESTGFYYVDFD